MGRRFSGAVLAGTREWESGEQASARQQGGREGGRGERKGGREGGREIICRRHTPCPPHLRHDVRRRAESAARIRGRHTPVSASSLQSCAGSAARVCGLHTRVSASTPRPYAESAAGGTRTCPPRLRHHVRRALRAFAGGKHRLRLVSAIKCGERCAHLLVAHACVRLVSFIIGEERCASAAFCWRHTQVSASSPQP